MPLQSAGLSARIVFSRPLDALHDRTIDLSPHFTEERYRFIDTDAFIHRRLLNIHETAALPDDYTTVSYVWHGLVAEPAELAQHGSFRVSCGINNDGTPREDGGPISLKVLEYACCWATKYSASYLWLDRICIMQTSLCDKAWQISRMYDIYEQCAECVVLPGGLQRLASVFEETTWAERAWTYQEAIVTWEHATVFTSDWHRSKGEQHWLVEGECHWQYLHQLFAEGDDLLDRSTAPLGDRRPCLIFGSNRKALGVLERIMEYKVWNYAAIDTGNLDQTIEEHIIRRLIILGVAMRTSSRPVDMVLSILGVAGVQDSFPEDIGLFKENERFRSTMALANAVLRQDTTDSEDRGIGEPGPQSSLVDFPLWQYLSLVGVSDATKMPSLSELAWLLDNCDDGAELEISACGCMKRTPLLEWTFDVGTADPDESKARAATIASQIPEVVLLKIYHGELVRHRIQHDEEGMIELCRTLTTEAAAEDDHLTVNGDDEFAVFGWSLRLERHPYVRFYKFDISYLFQ